MRKGNSVRVVCKIDGRTYNCKVVNVKNDRVRIHYVGWGKGRDEWLKLDDPRLLDSNQGDQRTKRASTEEPRNLPSRNSTEEVIDDFYDRYISNTQPVSLEAQFDPSNMQQYPFLREQMRKRPRELNSTEPLENDKKRGLFDRSGSSQGSQTFSDVLRRGGPAANSSLVQGLPGSAARPSSTTPPMTLMPPEASVATAGPRGGRDGVVSTEALDETIMCGLCQLPTDQVKVGCTNCGKFFHAEALCLGVSSAIISVLLSDQSGALAYQCCLCRMVQTGDRAWLLQLMRIVGALVRQTRMARVKDPIPTQRGDTSDVSCRREEILAQVREVREREKRKDSIIVRGFRGISIAELPGQMRTICDLLDIPDVVLSDVHKIGSTDYFRARITDPVGRNQLLLKCHELRRSEEFFRVYINKDLTYQQRQDLRRKRNQANAVGTPDANSDPVVVPNRSGAARTTGANSVPVLVSERNSVITLGQYACLPEVELGQEYDCVAPNQLDPAQSSSIAREPARRDGTAGRNSMSRGAEIRGTGRGRGRGRMISQSHEAHTLAELSTVQEVAPGLSVAEGTLEECTRRATGYGPNLAAGSNSVEGPWSGGTRASFADCIQANDGRSAVGSASERGHRSHRGRGSGERRVSEGGHGSVADRGLGRGRGSGGSHVSVVGRGSGRGRGSGKLHGSGEGRGSGRGRMSERGRGNSCEQGRESGPFTMVGRGRGINSGTASSAHNTDEQYNIPSTSGVQFRNIPHLRRNLNK